MQIVRTVSLAAVAAIQILQPATRSEPVLVTTVFDGDTVDVRGLGHVRLLGIDAPEIGHGFDTTAPYGREARERLADLVLHRWVRLEYEGPRDDVYGRRLAYVLLEDGTVVNAVLVREGFARISARVPLSRLDELRRAEAEAMALHRGMWQNAPFASETIASSRVTRSAKTSAKARPKRVGVARKTPKPKVDKVPAQKKKTKKTKQKKDGGVSPS
jgi:micrococcal nuclease